MSEKKREGSLWVHQGGVLEYLKTKGLQTAIGT